MLEKIQKVDNPLTIIAIFAGLTEIADTAVLPFVTAANQSIFIWFLMAFPSALVIIFFGTLHFNPKVLYGPGDYRDDRNFLNVLFPDRSAGIRISDAAAFALPESGGPKGGAELPIFADLSDKVNRAASLMMKSLSEKTGALFTKHLITGYSFAPHGQNLFLLSVDRKPPPGTSESLNQELRIIRATEKGDDVELSIPERGYQSTNPAEFAEMLFRDIETALTPH